MSAVYEVLTEFVFHTAGAEAASKSLENRLEDLGAAAAAVQTGIQSAAMSMLGQIGIYGGITGAIYAAVKAADKYQQSQRSIANIFLSNGMFSGANSFEDSMKASAEAMENMKRTAREFSLPVADFVSTAKMVGAGLMNHGLDDGSMKNSIMLTRGYLKSAPILGIDPGQAQGELMDMVNGRAHMSARLAQRLVGETAAMRPYAGGVGAGSRTNSGLTAFNSLTPEKRLKTLTDALMQFGSNAKVVEENAKSLASQMQRLGDNFTGMFSILRPIGEAILEPLKTVLLKLNLWLESEGEKTAKHLALIVKDMFGNPEKLFADIKQARAAKGDFQEAWHLVEVEGIIHGTTLALRALGFELKGGLLNTGLQMAIKGLRALAGWFVEIGGLTFLLTMLGYIMAEVVAPLALFTMIMQGLSRGLALAEIENAKWLAANMSKIGELFVTLKDALTLILSPVWLVIDGLAELTKHLLSHNIAWDLALMFLEQFAMVLTGIGNVIAGVLSLISGSMQVMLTLFDAFTSRDLGKLKGIPDDFMAGFTLMWDKLHRKTSEVDTSATSQNNISINSINIQNQFKEQMEPDRIAFSLKDQLIKAATNPLQSTGRSQSARAAVGG